MFSRSCCQDDLKMHSAPNSPVLSVKTEFVGLASSAVCRALFLSSAGLQGLTLPLPRLWLWQAAPFPGTPLPGRPGFLPIPAPNVEATLVSALLGVGGSSAPNRAASGQPSCLRLLFTYQQCQDWCLTPQNKNEQMNACKDQCITK